MKFEMNCTYCDNDQLLFLDYKCGILGELICVRHFE